MSKQRECAMLQNTNDQKLKKIPATIVTGFLGAGKTSLIQNLLATARGKKIALIINEFGDLGVDKELILGCKIEGCSVAILLNWLMVAYVAQLRMIFCQQ